MPVAEEGYSWQENGGRTYELSTPLTPPTLEELENRELYQPVLLRYPEGDDIGGDDIGVDDITPNTYRQFLYK
jgi:hypothetical protein